MKITVNRSSVCMGDDINDHERMVELKDGASCRDLLDFLRSSGFFACVSGNNVVWVLTAGGVCILVYYTKTGRVSQLIPETRLARICEKGKLHFNYYCSPANWRSVIESCFISSDPLIKRDVWLAECDYCDRLNGKQ